MGNSNNHELYLNNNYWEAVFSSFLKLKNFSEIFKAKKDSINQDSPFYNIFYNIFTDNEYKNEYIQEFKNIIISKNNKELLTNPKKLFNFVIKSLHEELKEKSNQESHIASNEFMDIDKRAYELYLKYVKCNSSIIQKQFFGTKKISKTCQSCNSTFYKYDYLKFLPFNLQNMKGFIKIEYLYKNIQREFNGNFHCPNCNSIKNFKIKITVTEKPEILIFFFYNYENNVFVDFDCKFGKEYYLKSFIMLHDNSNLLNQILICRKSKKFISYGRENGSFYKFESHQIKQVKNKEIIRGNSNPYILFYAKSVDKNDEEKNNIKSEFYSIGDSKETLVSNIKNKNKKNIRISSSQIDYKTVKKFENKKIFAKSVKNYSNDFDEIINNKNENISSEVSLNSNSNTNFNELNNINLNINNNMINVNKSISISNSINNSINKNKNKISLNSLIYKSMNDNIFINKSNNSLSSEREKTIRLYFKYTNGDVFFVDVSESMTFENIKNELKNANEWINIENAILYYNERKIENDETPQNYGMNDGDYIYINTGFTLIDEN